MECQRNEDTPQGSCPAKRLCKSRKCPGGKGRGVRKTGSRRIGRTGKKQLITTNVGSNEITDDKMESNKYEIKVDCTDTEQKIETRELMNKTLNTKPEDKTDGVVCESMEHATECENLEHKSNLISCDDKTMMQSSMSKTVSRKAFKRKAENQQSDCCKVGAEMMMKKARKSNGRKMKKKESEANNVDKRRVNKKVDPVVDLDLKMRMLKEVGAKNNKYIGAHVTISGCVACAVPNAVMLGARAFGLFLKNQRQWISKPLDGDDASLFRRLLKEYGFSPSMVIPHGSYLMNCGSPREEILQKSRAMLLDELKRCEMLGLDLFNFHPGSTCGKISPEESISLIAESINMALEQTEHVTAVLEMMSCQGNTVGGRFSEIAEIIERVNDKARIGVCIDTCHVFAAGYDIKSKAGYEKMMNEFNEVIGFKYLKAVHLNDSKGQLGCHRDLHENIGEGEIGLAAFKRLMNDPRFNNIPMIIETPDDDDTKWIKLLNSLMD